MQLRTFSLGMAIVCLTILASSPAAWSIDVTGMVRDSVTGTPIPNATVIILETGDSTQSDAGGAFFFPAVAVGTYTFMVGATDYGPLIMTGVVVAANQPPVLANIGSRSVTEGMLLAFAVSATDPEGSVPVLTTSSLPSGAAFIDHGDGTGTFTWTPSYVQSGTYSVTFYATDAGSAVDSEVISIIVMEAGNQAPLMAPIGPKSVKSGDTLDFVVTATDPEGAIPVFVALPRPPGSIFTDHGDGSATFHWEPGDPDIGSYSVKFFASDGSLSDSEVVVITVRDSASCCLGSSGNVNGDPGDVMDIADLTFLIDHLFISFTPLPCPEEGNINGDIGGTVDIADLTALIDALFISFSPPAPCL